jgi:hypothetical protein
MKKCPKCNKEFDDAMRFCQTDGTPLVDEAPPVDPYKTMVASPADIAAMIPPSDPKPEPEPEPPAASEEVLDIPAADPKKTMYASEEEIRSAMAEVDKPIVDLPPVGEPEPAPPEFIAPPADESPAYSKTTPPIPSPFDAAPPSAPEPAAPVFNAPEPEPPSFVQPEPPAPAFNPFEHSAPEPSAPIAHAEFTPTPAAQDDSWQNEPMQNPQYQPGSGIAAGGQNQTLAIVSLVLGIAGLIFCLGLTGPPALITGIMAKKKATNNPAEYGGAGLALGGIITGILGTLVLLLVVAYFAFVFLFVGASLMAQ